MQFFYSSKKTLILIFFIYFIVGCSKNLKNYYDEINKYSIEKNYKKIDSYIDLNKDKFYGKTSILLYYLDKGFFLHLSGDYQNSNKYFTLAKNLYDENYTKSITNQISTLAINDKITPYYGDAFEISMLLAFKALNYLMMGDQEGAAVEARASIFYLKTLGVNNNSKKVYKDDAFLRYLTGLIFENIGEYNDAFISYTQALKLYNTKYFNFTPPQDLFDSAIDMAKKLGFIQEIKDLNAEYPDLAKKYTNKGTDEIILLHYNGLVPYRISTTLQISFWDAWSNVNLYRANNQDETDIENAMKAINSIASDEQLTVAFPSYIKSKYTIDVSEVRIKKDKNINEIYKTSNITDIGYIALKNFDDRKTEIYAKSLARAAIKFTLVRNINKNIDDNVSNGLLAFALKAGTRTVSSLTEDADKRSWRVLPDIIKMARIPIDRNQDYELEVIYKTKNNFEKTEKIYVHKISEKDKNKENIKKFFIVRMTE